MEYSLPPVAPPESSFQPEASVKKPRWNFSELFRKKELPADAPKPEASLDQAQAATERAPEAAPAKPRRFGESILRLLRGEAAKPAEASASPKTEAEEAPAPVKTAEATPEVAPAPTIIEHAQELGRGVIGLLKRVKHEVIAADKTERVGQPTDVQPLDEADERVRAAMHELIAPIEAYAAEHGIVQQSEPESAATRELSPAPAAAHSGGGDGENPTVFRLPIFEAAMTVAAGATEYMSDKMERHRQRRSRLGLFAVGAATVGVLVYTWRRQHELKREQRAMQKEHKRFEKEVRQQQARDRRRIEELEQVPITTLTQVERQEHVREVSRFAVAQAETIHTVARNRQQTHMLQPVAERFAAIKKEPATRPATSERPVLQPVASTGAAERIPRTLTEAPHQTIVNRELRQAERPRSVVERALDALQRKHTATEASTISPGGFGGLASTLVSLTTGKAPDDPVAVDAAAPQAVQQTITPRRRTNQEWLLGVGLALGIASVVLLLSNIL